MKFNQLKKRLLKEIEYSEDTIQLINILFYYGQEALTNYIKLRDKFKVQKIRESWEETKKLIKNET